MKKREGWVLLAFGLLFLGCGDRSDVALFSGSSGQQACSHSPVLSVSQCTTYARSGAEYFQNCCDAVDYGHAEVAMSCQLASQIVRTGRDPYLR